MARQKLNLTPEERRAHDNEMHRKQVQRRKEKQIKARWVEIVNYVVEIYERLGWDRTELLLGGDEEMVEKIADEIIEDNRYGITLGKQAKIKAKKENEN